MSKKRSSRLGMALPVLSVLCACASEPAPEAPPAPASRAASAAPDTGSSLPDEVIGIAWQWVGFVTPVETITADDPARYTIQFERDGRAAIRADCNRGSTSYTVGADRHIAFKPIALTRMACPPGSQSDRFVAELGRATSWFIKDGELFLELPVDSGTLRFRRPPAA